MIDMFSKEKESLLDGDVSSTIEKVSANGISLNVDRCSPRGISL